jgi:hypothetical protein
LLTNSSLVDILNCFVYCRVLTYALKSGKNTDKALEEVQVKINSYSEQALMTLGLDNHYVLADSVSEHLRGLAIETARQIEKEYDCKTPSEKILAEMVSSAYVRTQTKLSKKCR